ncbi:ribonuclease T2-like protein [Syncephalis fuscata]|nr:ribonuclease T2-like protein [Syncephalis fuscata]
MFTTTTNTTSFVFKLLLVSGVAISLLTPSSVLSYRVETAYSNKSTWHAKHAISPQSEALLLAKLSRQSSLGTCPNELSCGIKKIDRCCSPVMGQLVFVQQWYPTLGPPTDFTMHGLWPNNCDGGHGPWNGCDTKRNYPNLGQIIQSADPALYGNMTTYWPSYKGNAPSFWSHEWNKHGTCVSTLEPECTSPAAPPHHDVLEYFHTALSLRLKFNPYTALASAGIVPGKLYDNAAFKKALEDAWGVSVVLKCRRGQISEVWMWMKVRGREQYVPTNSTMPNSGTCNSRIYYPPKGKKIQELNAQY